MIRIESIGLNKRHGECCRRRFEELVAKFPECYKIELRKDCPNSDTCFHTWFTQRLEWAPYDRATEPEARESSSIARV